MKHFSISSKVILRTHRNSFNELHDSYDKNIEYIFSHPYIQNAIRIASLDLYNRLKVFSTLEDKKKEQVRNSFGRYISRMSTRCTPFGLFAGCSIGTIEENTNLIISRRVTRHTRLDMSYLCSLSQYLSETPEIKYKLKYYPNNSLYVIGNEYRFIEYKYLKDTRIHQISSVKKTFYLDKVLQISKHRVPIENLYSLLINGNIKEDESIEYINNLIDSQILVSELDPTVTGDDLLTRIINILDKIEINTQHHEMLKSIQELVAQIDEYKENPIEKYKEIEDIAKKIGTSYNPKYLLQVDINNMFINNTIGASIKKEIYSTVTFLNKICTIPKHIELIKFQETFIKRFEGKEIPLSIALDPEIGIGYPVDNGGKDESPLLEGFTLPDNKKNSIKSVNLNTIQSVLFKKLNNRNNSREIEIRDEDFANSIENWNDLPDTFSVFFEIIKDNKKETLIRLKSVGNSSAANLLSRFAYTDKSIENFVKGLPIKNKLLILTLF